MPHTSTSNMFLKGKWNVKAPPFLVVFMLFVQQRQVGWHTGGALLGSRSCALDPWNFWYRWSLDVPPLERGDPCEWKREHALPAVAEAHQDFYTARRGGGGVVAWNRRIFVSRESAVKVAIIKWTRSVLCSKAPRVGKRWKTGADVPSSRDPSICVCSL